MRLPKSKCDSDAQIKLLGAGVEKSGENQGVKEDESSYSFELEELVRRLTSSYIDLP